MGGGVRRGGGVGGGGGGGWCWADLRGAQVPFVHAGKKLLLLLMGLVKLDLQGGDLSVDRGNKVGLDKQDQNV